MICCSALEVGLWQHLGLLCNLFQNHLHGSVRHEVTKFHAVVKIEHRLLVKYELHVAVANWYGIQSKKLTSSHHFSFPIKDVSLGVSITCSMMAGSITLWSNIDYYYLDVSQPIAR